MGYTVGDKVNVKMDVTGTIDYVNHDGSFDINIDDNTLNLEYIPAEYMSLADPADWPPQLGDIWETDDNEFFVREYRSPAHPDHYFFEGAKSDHPCTFTSNNLDRFKGLNPRLVRRRSQ